MSETLNLSQDSTRRDFIKNIIFSGTTLILSGKFGIIGMGCAATEGEPFAYSMIVVDYDKCTGCRTCETVCSAYNHQRMVNGEMLPGLGNPHYTNIRVYGFNPDVDVPAVCAMCPDAPCIEACPVEPHPKTGRRALYREPQTLAIKNDLDRCIGCGRCAEACRVGVIIPNPETDKPERMCTLCGGDPQCVKYCPYGALSHVKVDTGREFYGMKPERIAEELIKRWYKN
ncbi:MAG: 4Fe-4S dicluster domain-containing protein [Deltaproteobacteria bacterium]|nr:4Fe-4S dicluster domain-containing protein [Deltaproteobacteria bacterium]MBW2100977.1 4Fe-4S dicluster domain-containing protein [Deltaproteobacteria bacterium]